MQLIQFVADEDAVSPVIGVILMVAITVILAAVIGTFVLGLEDEVQNDAPQASFTFDFNDQSATSSNGLANSEDHGELTVTHDGGDRIIGSRVSFEDDEGQSVDAPWGSSDVTAGDSVTIDIGDDDTMRIVWVAENPGKSATIGKYSAPKA